MGRQTIHFEDNGQDLLRWTVKHGIVIESNLQGWVWDGTKIVKPPKVGRKLKVVFPKGESATLGYKVVRVDEEPDMVVCAECGAETADPGRGVRCEEDNGSGDVCRGELLKKREWTTHNKEALKLELTEAEAELFDRAEKMFFERRSMAEIGQVYLGDSVLYRGRTGAEVVKLPIYQALKDMAKQRGLDDGMLSDRPGTKPSLDSFKVPRAAH